jgi:hypothetical protein
MLVAAVVVEDRVDHHAGTARSMLRKRRNSWCRGRCMQRAQHRAVEQP